MVTCEVLIALNLELFLFTFMIFSLKNSCSHLEGFDFPVTI